MEQSGGAGDESAAVCAGAGFDTDNDGLPNDWETAHGLTNGTDDHNGDFDADGYTNLEEYVNELAEWPAPFAIEFGGGTNNRYAQITNWEITHPSPGEAPTTTFWQPSRFDLAVISSGTAVVDAVGQHARELQLAWKSVDTATLDVTAGWIDISERLDIAGGGSGTVNHSGGVVAAPLVVVGGGGGASMGVYNLSGSGLLRAGALTKGSVGGSGEFNFTGGVLSADVVTFDLVNDGGVISPGDSPGSTHVMGDLAMSDGAILLELAGEEDGEFDELIVDDVLAAGGTLKVELLGGFTPAEGNTFDLLDFASAHGTFALNLPALSAGLAWDASDLLTTGELSVVAATADFDGDGDVDGADFLTWQRGFGLMGPDHEADGDANGDDAVDGLDLAAWQSQFLASSAVGAGEGVPEPPTCWAAWVLLALGAALRRL